MTPNLTLKSDSSLNAILPDLMRRREEALRRVDALKSKLEGAEDEVRNIDMALKGIKGLVGGGAKSAPLAELPASSLNGASHRNRVAGSLPARSREPRGMDAIAVVLTNAVEEGLTLGELTQELDRRGWLPKTEEPQNAVRASANRLRRKDRRFVFEGGRFAFRPHRQTLEPEGGGSIFIA